MNNQSLFKLEQALFKLELLAEALTACNQATAMFNLDPNPRAKDKVNYAWDRFFMISAIGPDL